jgi:hypothetical protein
MAAPTHLSILLTDPFWSRFNGDPPVIWAITAFQLATGCHQPGINQLGKEAITIRLWEKAPGEHGGGKETGLSGEVGQAHREKGLECMALELPYGLAPSLCKLNM